MAKIPLRDMDYFVTNCSLCKVETDWNDALGEKPLCKPCYDRMLNRNEQAPQRKYDQKKRGYISKKREKPIQKTLADILPRYRS